MVTRTDVLLRTVDRGASIIEIGPSYNGIAPKVDGWNTRIVDVGTKSELIEKYRAAPVDINRIEEVDFVWRDGPLDAAVPRRLHASFDVLIASHVIEHTPDLVELLSGAASLLTAAGLLILAIPDKRFCADYFRPITTTGEVLAAHRHKRTRHDGRTLFDYFSRSVLARYQHPWNDEPAWHQCWGRDLIDEMTLVDAAYTVKQSILEERVEPPDLTGDDRGDRLIAELVDAKVTLQMLRAELDQIRNTRDALAVGLDQAKTTQNLMIAELNHTKSARDTLAVESEKWFQATIAVTADHSPSRPVSRTPFWRQLFKPFNGRNGNQTITLANRARDAGNWTLAVRYYRDALNSWPHDPDLWSQCAQALMNAGRTTEAAIVFQRSRELQGLDLRE